MILRKKETGYLTKDGKLTYSAFNYHDLKDRVLPECTNLTIVEKMANMGILKASKALSKLNGMTSRQRSESGLYWKLQKLKEWDIAHGKLLGLKPNKKVNVYYWCEVKKNTPARLNVFNSATYLYNDNLTNIKVPYCKNETIDVIREITPFEY